MNGNLERDIILARFESGREELREKVAIRRFEMRGPGLRSFVAEKYMAIIGADSAGKVALIHLLTTESIVVVIGGAGNGGKVVGGHGEKEVGD